MSEYHNGVDEVNWEEIYELLDEFVEINSEYIFGENDDAFERQKDISFKMIDNFHIDSLITRIQKLAREKSELQRELEEVQQECYDLTQKLKKEQESKRYIDWLKQGTPYTQPYYPPVQVQPYMPYDNLEPYRVWCGSGQVGGVGGNFQTWL